MVLTPEQRERRKEIYAEVVQEYNVGPKLFSKIIVCYEIWTFKKIFWDRTTINTLENGYAKKAQRE